jgi:hypothetical protein
LEADGDADSKPRALAQLQRKRTDGLGVELAREHRQPHQIECTPRLGVGAVAADPR